MKNEAPLQLIGAFVLETRLLAVEPDGDFYREVFDDYTVAYDSRMDVRSATETALYAKIAVNGGREPLPGYSLFAETLLLFGFPADLPEDERVALLSDAGKTASVAYLRNYFAEMTAFGPFGKYTLPDRISEL